MHLSKIFTDYLQKRNKKIIKFREKGKSMKFIAYKFKLSERHLRRIIENFDKMS